MRLRNSRSCSPMWRRACTNISRSTTVCLEVMHGSLCWLHHSLFIRFKMGWPDAYSALGQIVFGSQDFYEFSAVHFGVACGCLGRSVGASGPAREWVCASQYISTRSNNAQRLLHQRMTVAQRPYVFRSTKRANRQWCLFCLLPLDRHVRLDQKSAFTFRHFGLLQCKRSVVFKKDIPFASRYSRND